MSPFQIPYRPVLRGCLTLCKSDNSTPSDNDTNDKPKLMRKYTLEEVSRFTFPVNILNAENSLLNIAIESKIPEIYRRLLSPVKIDILTSISPIKRLDVL